MGERVGKERSSAESGLYLAEGGADSGEVRLERGPRRGVGDFKERSWRDGNVGTRMEGEVKRTGLSGT